MSSDIRFAFAARTVLLRVGSPITGVWPPAVWGGTGALRYTVSGMPPGLSHNPVTGMLYGTPQRAGEGTGTWTVTDAEGHSASTWLCWTVME